MGAALLESRKFLEERYRRLLGIAAFGNSIDDKVPAWVPVNLGDLRRRSADETNAAVLVDPEVGTLLYLIEYTIGQDIPAIMVRALALRTRLLLGLDERDKSVARDRDGSWRVVMYWLVDSESLAESWEGAIAELRSNAPHMEEIPVDIVRRGGDSWNIAFRAHGFPRLMLNVRSVLQIQNREDVERWSAADALVDDELRGFSRKFSDKTQRELALEVEKQVALLKEQHTPKADVLSAEVRLPNRLGIRKFRNIREAQFDLAGNGVNCSVIAGPNGSGKSSLFEAISLGVFGSSNRYWEYLRDPDAGTRRGGLDYIDRHLKNLSYPEWGVPELNKGEKWEMPSLPASPDDAVRIEQVAEGCLLSQEKSGELCKRSAAELAADVLRGYSDLANGVQWFVEDEFSKANSVRQDLLRSYGLRANITKVETAHERVAEQLLARCVQYSPSNLVAWLTVVGNEFGDYLAGADRVARLWQRWDEAQKDVAQQCVAILEEDVARSAIESWLKDFNLTLSETERLLGGHVQALIASVRTSGESMIDGLLRWGSWLDEQSKTASVGNEQTITEIRSELDRLSRLQAEISRKGVTAKSRLDHLNAAKTGIASRWIEEHAASCPTCNSDLSARGGFGKVLDEIIQETTLARAALEVQFKDVAVATRQANERLRGLGISANPLPDEEQQVYVGLLSPFLTVDSTLETTLKSMSARERLLSFVRHLRSAPALPGPVAAAEVAKDTAKTVIAQCILMSSSFNAPNNWASIRKRLSEQMGDVVKSHLPNTLEALWMELVLNLTAAPWLLRLKPALHVRTQRNAQTLTIRIGTGDSAPLARHILNHAEVNILGLAWFFVRFITSGRFVVPIMVLDDPAQQMDQTTYRDLCRMLETVVRIHRRSKAGLTLVVFFHQEDRALDAAKALNATLLTLSWADFQSSKSIKRSKALSDIPPLAPVSIFV